MDTFKFPWLDPNALNTASNHTCSQGCVVLSPQIPFALSAIDLLLKTEPCKKILKLEPVSPGKVTQYYLQAQ